MPMPITDQFVGARSRPDKTKAAIYGGQFEKNLKFK
jgi:hypothetical protein